MAYSKVILNGTTLMDVTNDTVDADNLLSGETATKNNGLRTTGTVVVPTKTSDLTNDSGFITSAQAPVQSVNGQTGAVSITIPTVPSASTTTPSMDGTASYGSGTTYARANHVHPTDTSRQATLVSGTNIKTINNESLLGSGNITIQGGGGGTGLRLAWAYFNGSWTSIGNSNWTKTVTINGVTDDDFVQCFPAPSNKTNGHLVSVYTHTSNSVTLVYYATSSSVSFDSTLIFAIMEASADIAYACGSTYGLTQTTFTPGDTVTFTNTATGAQRVIVTINRMTTGVTLTSATLDYGQTLTFTMPKGGVFIKTESTGGGND